MEQTGRFADGGGESGAGSDSETGKPEVENGRQFCMPAGSAASSDFGGRDGKSDPAGIFRCGNIRRKVSGDQIAWKFHYKQADRRFCRCAGSCDTGRQLRQPVYAAFKQRPYDAEI